MLLRDFGDKSLDFFQAPSRLPLDLWVGIALGDQRSGRASRRPALVDLHLPVSRNRGEADDIEELADDVPVRVGINDQHSDLVTLVIVKSADCLLDVNRDHLLCWAV